MTEARSESCVPPSMTTKSSSSSKLRPTAKEFVFNSAAPVWTPSVVASPSPAFKPSQLKLSAKPFVPSIKAPVFMPASRPMTPTPVKKEEARLVEANSVLTPLDKEKQGGTGTSEGGSTPTTSGASSNASEPESDEGKDDGQFATQREAMERDAKQQEDVYVAQAQVEDPATVVAEQAVIRARILYTIQQLLELEPETDWLSLPTSVKESGVAVEWTTTSVHALALESTGHDGRRTDASRPFTRHESSPLHDVRGRRDRGFSRTGRGPSRSHPETAPALEDCAPLDINEATRWKPSHAKSRLDDPVETVDASLKEAKAILNKLSIEKFAKLSDQLIDVAVRGVAVLEGVIDMVIAKAQMEWHFATMYAELCAKIAQTAMPAITVAEGDVVTDPHKLFRKLLLQQCQKEFQTKPALDRATDLTEAERVEKALLLKRASLGHIRFVGELFKQRMLSSRIMHECVSILFGDLATPDEESLECLCNLLSTIGKALEANVCEPAEREHINGYYTTIKKLSCESKLLCTRVRFMLQDLLELRKNRWVARRKETKAMTIAEVHAEVAREAKEKEQSNLKAGRLQRSHSMTSAKAIASNDRRRSSGGGASAAWKARASATSGPTVDADGWETVTGGARSKGVKHRSNSDRILAPSSGGLPRHPSTPRLSSSNSFASLSSGRKERSRSNSSSSLKSARGREENGLPPTRLSAKSSPGQAIASEKSEETAVVPPLSAEAFEKKVKAILDEYVELADLDEAYASLTELNAAAHYGLIPPKVLSIGFEKGEKEREAIATFLAGLYDRQVVTRAAFTTALTEVLEVAEDMELDIPKTLVYLSEMVAPSVVAGSVTLSQLVAMSTHLCYNGKAAQLIGATLAGIVSCENEAKVVELLATASVDFKALLAEPDRNDEAMHAFYRDYSLEFLA